MDRHWYNRHWKLSLLLLLGVSSSKRWRFASHKEHHGKLELMKCNVRQLLTGRTGSFFVQSTFTRYHTIGAFEKWQGAEVHWVGNWTFQNFGCIARAKFGVDKELRTVFVVSSIVSWETIETSPLKNILWFFDYHQTTSNSFHWVFRSRAVSSCIPYVGAYNHSQSIWKEAFLVVQTNTCWYRMSGKSDA